MKEDTNKKLTTSVFRSGMRILLRRVMKYRREVIILSVLSLLAALGNGIIPYISGKLIDVIILLSSGSAVMQTAFILLAVWLVVQIVTSIADWRINVRNDRLQSQVYGDYVADAYSTLLRLPISFHRDVKMGKTTNMIDRTADRLRSITGNVLLALASEFLSIGVAFVVVFSISPKLAWVLVIAVFLYAFVIWITVGPLTALLQRMHEESSKVWGDMYDMLGNVDSVKQQVKEETESKKIGGNIRRILLGWLEADDIWNRLFFSQRVITMLTQLVIFAISLFEIANGVITVGELVAFNAYAALMFGPLMVIGRNWEYINNGLVALVETDKVLSQPPEKYQANKKVELTEPTGTVRFKDVSFGYDDGKQVLFDINLDALPGEKIALVGESGVGKSTLVELISGYYFAKKGQITVDGVDVKEWPLAELRKKIAIVSQEISLFNEDIRTNIAYGSRGGTPTQEELESAARQASALEFIEEFPKGWKQRVGEDGVKLSSGQKQRIAIARAIISDPEILILDEPTSALDPISEVQITKALNTLMKGRTTFIVAHRLSTVRTADKILVFKKGRIVQSGTHNELVNQEGEYKRLHDAHIGLHD